MDLENLQKKYSNLLIKYNKAVSDYVNYLNTKTNDPTKNYTSIKGMSFIGGSNNKSSAKNIQQCKAQCADNSSCSGATFISNQCQIITGNGKIVPSSNDSYAIVPKEKQLLLNMERINKELIETNDEILNKIKASEPVYNDISNEINNKLVELQTGYNELEIERENIKKLVYDYETLNKKEEENTLYLTKNYYYYILLLILAVVTVILLGIVSYSSLTSSSYSSSSLYGSSIY